ncbi:MAG: hypothetical protein K9H64_13515 [Bacteroidales bacterium]|nr:hypothetical protein [Bacteroidales bacterium]MCF8456371.1 hypothetical protein [Bacteroidales bacterium]
MRFVSDTSPIIALSKIRHLHVFEKLFGKVLIPTSVSDEFLRNCTPDEKSYFEHACENYINVTETRGSYKFSRRLDIGERDALTLALEQKAIVIIDDRKGYNEAKELNLIPVSTRAVLRIAEERNIISDYQELEKALRMKSFFLPGY